MSAALRGRPKTLKARPGKGYFGEIFQPDDDGCFMSELAMHIELDGQPHRIPVVVPTLTRDELAHLTDGGELTPDILSKAMGHARGRIAAHQSAFAAAGERSALPL